MPRGAEVFSEILYTSDEVQTALAELEDMDGHRVLVPVKVRWGVVHHIGFSRSGRVVEQEIPGPVLELPSRTLFSQPPESLPWEQGQGENARHSGMRLVELIVQ